VAVHLGGWIIPGLAMMVEALEARTGDLAGLRRASPPAAALRSRRHRAGHGRGRPAGGAGAVWNARARLEAHCGAEPRLFLAGGDAGAPGAALPGAELVPELVLLGLARRRMSRLIRAAILNGG
jgi:type III pantothenate kinase